jgi:diguanylate cyclase (GGDEF)-like protein
MAPLKRLLRVSNWPFAFKMGFCPTLAMVVLAGMGLHGILAAASQAALINAVVHHDLSTAMGLSDSATRLQEINSRLYRLTTLQATKAADLIVTSEIATLVGQTTSLADFLNAQASDVSATAERDDILRVATSVRVYRDAIDVFGSMLEIDFSSAVEFFRPFDKNATQVLALMRDIADRAVTNAKSRAGASMRLAEAIRLSLIAALVAGSLLLFGIAALLTRATVRSVNQIAAATGNVAQGHSSVDITALARGDELGTIVRSLAVFQANVSKIAFLAHHDPLTKLPNRVLFHDRIQQALKLLDRNVGFAVLCLDLDRFKLVNDTLGHGFGDELLRRVAERLQACVREGDTVARLGGDEFAIILLHVSEPTEIDVLATRIIETIGSSYDIDHHLIHIGTSIGMALAPADGAISDELLKKADTALYDAKSGGGGKSCFYEDAMNIALQSRREVEVGLRRAIADGEFVLYYQPLVDAQSHRVCSCEALIRWNNPEQGLIFPDAFIPVAEASGLIGAIGQWVLNKACHDAASWSNDIKIAVNLSPSQFNDRNLVGYIRAALAASGLPANRLELEITESVLLNDSNVILAILVEIKALGVQISMDDFGTGYSSLSYLRSFPFDKVKIDRSFIRDLPNDKNAMAIIRAIVGLGKTFGMTVTAEGVETSEQALQLALEDCTHLQGYLFSRAVPAANIPALIEKFSTAPAAPSGAWYESLFSGAAACQPGTRQTAQGPALAVSYLVLVRRRNVLFWHVRLPAAAQRLVKCDKIGGHCRRAAGKLLLRREQVGLRHQHCQKVRHTLLVSALRKIQRPLILSHRPDQFISPRLFRLIGRQRVVNVVPGLQDSLLEVDRRLLLLGLAQLQSRAQLAALEDRDGQAGTEGILLRIEVEEILDLQRLQPHAAGEIERRIEIRLRHADIGRRGMKLRLHLTDVRPSPCQFGRQPDRNTWRHWRHRLRGRKLGSQRVRRLAQQQTQRVDCLCFLLLKARDLRQRRMQLGGCVRYVEICGHPAGGTLLRQAKTLPGGANILAGNAELGLRATKLDVVARDLGQTGQQHGALCFLGGLGRRGGRFDRTPDGAPQINLIRRIEPPLVEIERLQAAALYPTRRVALGAVCTRSPGRAGNECEQAVVAGQFAHVGCISVQRREQGRPSNAELRARLGQSDARRLDVQIFRRHTLFQPGQLRIAKQSPPIHIDRFSHRQTERPLYRFLWSAKPRCGPRPVRPLEVRSQRAAGERRGSRQKGQSSFCFLDHRTILQSGGGRQPRTHSQGRANSSVANAPWRRPSTPAAGTGRRGRQQAPTAQAPRRCRGSS